ncbi:hypothetical protein OIU85_003063 [Salix viminalis]|uniref:Uncharacterized protein n=1 Tax=Salix viminalis TaxID=40686 RepID=A0A9Q0PYB8_SALVM|nr:hypothetical protein OIU85_003063 [Salix viminalis]
MMTKNEQAGGYTEAAPVRRHARAALPVCALGVRSVVSQIAAAKPALTSPGMQKFEFNAFSSSDIPLLSWCLSMALLLHSAPTAKRKALSDILSC